MTGELNPRFSFEAFVVGVNCELAATAAEAVANRPGALYNPLYIHGGEGLGKTHLLMAAGQRAARSDPPRSVEYTTPDRLAEAFNAAASAGQIEAFRHLLADVDVLLIDDAELLDRRPEIQAELARLIASAQSTGRHVLFAGRVPPSELGSLDASLASYISSGLVVGITAPEYEARLGVLRSRVQDRAAGLDEPVLEALAEFDIGNVRELISLLNRLIALDAVSEIPLTPDAARSLLEGEALTVDESPRPSAIMQPAPSTDEFADFLFEVSTTVHHQVEVWESDVAEAIERWGKEGISTARLEGLLEHTFPVPVEPALQDFERDAKQLVSLRKSVEFAAPDHVDDPVFKDPDRISEAQELAASLAPELESIPGPSPSWTFNTYVTSDGNRRPDGAMREAAASPGKTHNPLVIVGRTGVGKTHLLHATGNAMTATLDADVVCLSSRELGDMADTAEREGRTSDLQAVLMRGSAVLVDDVHLLAGREGAQRVLAALTTAALADGRQVVFTINAPPSELEGLSSDLLAHVQSAQSFALTAPDRELRRALAAGMLEGSGLVADADLVDYLADRPADSVRAVRSLVQRVLDAAESRGVAPSAALARELIEGALPRVSRKSGGLRTSGILVSPSSGVRSREKMVWSWPDPGERMIEELD